MQLVIEKAAAVRLRDLPLKRRLAMLDRLESLAADPFEQHPNVKPLQGEKDTVRLRLGDWREVYVVDRAASVVRVTVIEHRGRAYR